MKKIGLLIIVILLGCKRDYKKQNVEKVKQIEASKRNEKYVIAKSGLNYRKNPKGRVLGKFDYANKFRILKNTGLFESIKDGNGLVNGQWVGVEKGNDTVYVFDGYLTLKIKEYSGKCISKDRYNPDNPQDSIYVSFCKFKNYIFKSTGLPDYKGRYSWKYDLLKVEHQDTIHIDKIELFKPEKIVVLEKYLNQELKKEYETNLKDTNISGCIKLIDFQYYDLENFNISLEEREVTFGIDYDVPSACMNIGGSYVSISYNEFEKYLK